MADITLTGDVRTEFGKGAARRMRVANLIPATIYAGGEEPSFLQLPAKETTLALRHTNALFELKFGNETKTVDFYEVKAGEKIVVNVPVFAEGTPKGAAVAFVDIQEMSIKADVANLPERIVVSVEGLMDGDKVLVKDVVLPEGTELAMDDLEEPVVTVSVPEGDGEEAAEGADAAAEAPAAE